MAIGWSLSNWKDKYRAAVGGTWLILSGCTPDLQTVVLDHCTALKIADEVQVIVHADDEKAVTVQYSDAVKFEQGEIVRLHGSGGIILNCPGLRSIQALANSQLTIARAPNLQTIRAYGDSQISVEQMRATHLELRASGEARLAIEDIDVDEVELQAGGRTQVSLEGVTGRIALNTAGVASIDAGALRAQDVLIQGSGTGPVSVWATAHLHIAENVVLEPSVQGSPDVTDDRAVSQ